MTVTVCRVALKNRYYISLETFTAKVLTNDLIPLINVIRSREKHSAANHLAHYAAHRPNVDVLLVAHAEDDFGCAIVSRHDIRRHHESGAGCAGQAEVENLQGAVGLDDNI